LRALSRSSEGISVNNKWLRPWSSGTKISGASA
jgi:hypothetical protein